MTGVSAAMLLARSTGRTFTAGAVTTGGRNKPSGDIGRTISKIQEGTDDRLGSG